MSSPIPPNGEVFDPCGPRVQGHVLIRDTLTDEVLVNAKNSIHFENMAECLALGLANRPNGHIHQMVFGNGASTVSAVGTINYFPPNVVGQDAQLYNQTYSKVVDDLSSQNNSPDQNKMRVQHTQGTVYADVVITCTLDLNEPSAQETFDDATSNDGSYVFDELGLKTFDNISGDGRLLSHVIFHP
ncbi:MAG: hypothetical protein ACLGIM_00260, partial [Alphaproteobacteria bacterium]